MKIQSERFSPLAIFRTGALVCILAFALGGCSTSGTQTGDDAVQKYNNNPLTVRIPGETPPGDVSRAMETTLLGRKWQVKSISPDKAVGYLNHRGFDATVTLVSDGSIITILNEATYTDPQNGLERPGVPMGWLLNIQKDLVVNLR